MSRDYWMDNAATPGTHTLIDCGYVNEQAARSRADQILACVGKSNLQIAGFGRILIRVPPSKLAAVRAACPGIKDASEVPGYSWCTHSYLEQAVLVAEEATR